jgi:hypothetical protein
LLEIKQRNPQLFSSTRVCCTVCPSLPNFIFISAHYVQAWQFLDSHNVSLNIRRQVNDFFVGMLIYAQPSLFQAR